MISLDDLRKVYPQRGRADVVALDGISLDVPAGEIHGIVGQSGAGKSTLIRCLTALEQPTSGHVWVDGQDLSSLSPARLRTERRKIGMVFQGGNLLDARTAAANIAYPMTVARKARGSKHERVAELLDLVGLSGRGDSYPSQLSGGQKQRVGIARALASDPSVLLCDEPTSALDSRTTDQILELIRDVRDKTGVTVLIITHEMSVVREACDAVTLLEAGRIVESGQLANVVGDTRSRLGRTLVPTPRVDEADGVQRLIDVAFTAHPGEPTGSRVLALAAQLGADITAGTFETLGTAQVARLVLSVDTAETPRVVAALEAEGLDVEERRE